MIRNFIERLSFISLLIIAVACNANNAKTGNLKSTIMDTVFVVGCQGKITVRLGSVIEMKLDAIPGSGYQWLLKDSSNLLLLLDTEILKFSKPEIEQRMVGQPGYQILHFKAINKGEEMILLQYRRTWEKEISDSCSMKITVN